MRSKIIGCGYRHNSLFYSCFCPFWDPVGIILQWSENGVVPKGVLI